MTSPRAIDLVSRLDGGRDPSERAWVDKAECRHVDPELFFPIGAGSLTIDQVQAAKAVCARCPVADPCLDESLRTGQGHGVWGGTTPEERRLIRRRARQA